MDNDNTQPLFVAGQLPKDCYNNLNEFVTDLAKVLRIPIDTISVIKGAEGAQGKKGDTGPKGPQGPPGAGSTPYLQIIDIPLGASYVDIPYFTQWKKASYHISNKGLLGNESPDIDTYTPNFPFSVGTIVEHALPVQTTLRVYFTFPGAETVTEDDLHVLHINDYR